MPKCPDMMLYNTIAMFVVANYDNMRWVFFFLMWVRQEVDRYG